MGAMLFKVKMDGSVLNFSHFDAFASIMDPNTKETNPAPKIKVEKNVLTFQFLETDHPTVHHTHIFLGRNYNCQQNRKTQQQAKEVTST